uniref:Zinc finger family protein n=1 Tax=Rhizophora mucronata TaxID=61149 RepID=A0A2P2QVS8_RHIMU
MSMSARLVIVVSLHSKHWVGTELVTRGPRPRLRRKRLF